MLTSASNKTISASAPSVYLKQVEAAAGSHLHEWLASNLIPHDAYEAALADDFGSFLGFRAETIHQAVLSKAGW
jgi:hypothetical protein